MEWPATFFRIVNISALVMTGGLQNMFSGIAFTKNGFADVVPTGWLRDVAVNQGADGMILFAAFVVALVRKYVDR